MSKMMLCSKDFGFAFSKGDKHQLKIIDYDCYKLQYNQL